MSTWWRCWPYFWATIQYFQTTTLNKFTLLRVFEIQFLTLHQYTFVFIISFLNMSLYLASISVYILYLASLKKTWGCSPLLSGCWVSRIVWHASPCTNIWANGWPHNVLNKYMPEDHYYCLPGRQSSVQGTCFDVRLQFHTPQQPHLLYCFALSADMHTRTLAHPSLLRIFVGCRQETNGCVWLDCLHDVKAWGGLKKLCVQPATSLHM